MARRNDLKRIVITTGAVSVLSVAHTVELMLDGRGWAFMATVSAVLVTDTVIAIHALAATRSPHGGHDTEHRSEEGKGNE